jgi:Trypsin-like peptidase domain
MEYGWSIRLAGLTPAGLLASCLALPPAAGEAPVVTVAERAGPTAAPASIDWSRGDCLGQLRLLQQAASEGRLGPDEQPPFAVQLVAAPGDWLDAVPQLPIEADLPLALDDAGARCVLRIGPPREQSAAHRAVDVQDVRSAYQSGLRSERNPDYDATQAALRDAKEDAEGGHRVIRTGDPLLDLVGTTVGGLIGTVDRGVRQGEVDDAAAGLAATPRSQDRPVYRPYSFERVVVRAQKEAVVPVALLDASGRELRATELRQHERRELFVLRGLDPRDRDYEQHRSSSMTRAELARWARTPPALRLSSVAIALTEGAPAAETQLAEIAPAGPAPTEPISVGPELELWPEDAAVTEDLAKPWVDDTFEDPAPGRYELPRGLEIAGLEAGPDLDRTADAGSAAADPQAASVVAIRAGSAAGHGFYVRDDLVLTTYQLVRATSVVDVTTADGASVPALVAAVDAGRDLALLQMPRPGPAAALHEGSAPLPMQPAGASTPGLPVLVGDQVIGMTTGAAGAPGIVPIAAIHAFLDSQAALLAALP